MRENACPALKYGTQFRALSNATCQTLVQHMVPELKFLVMPGLWIGLLCLMSGCWWGSICERVLTGLKIPGPIEDAEHGASRANLPDQLPVPPPEEVRNVLSVEEPLKSVNKD